MYWPPALRLWSRRTPPPTLALLALLLLPSCTIDFSSSRESTPEIDAERLAWSGFSETFGLEVVATDEESGLDTMVRFALRGPREDIDRALTEAELVEATRPGNEALQTPLPQVDLADLVHPETGRDKWVNASGKTIYRLFVRGGTGDGVELLHVWAF